MHNSNIDHLYCSAALLLLPNIMSSGKSGFAFRQRAGRMDWRLISAANVEDILLRVKIDELQSLLDTITFSEFDSLEVRSNTIDNVAKLVHLMQLTIEYLLHHQESQLDKVRKLTSSQTKLSKKCQSYQASISSMKEEVRMYQKQLHILRKAVQSGGGGVNTELMFRLLQQPPKVVVPDNDQEKIKQAEAAQESKENRSFDIVKVILDHEHEARMVINNMLENQREAFAREVQSLHEAMRKMEIETRQHVAPVAEPTPNPLPTLQLALDNVKLQLEQSMRQMIDAVKEQNAAIRPSLSETRSSRSAAKSDPNVVNILQSAALESVADDIHHREHVIAHRELALQKREEAFVRRELASQNARILVNERTENLGVQRLFAVKLLWVTTTQSNILVILLRLFCSYSLVIVVVKRIQLRSFRHWLGKTLDNRIRAMVDGHAKQLVFVSTKRSGHEEELQQQLVNEQQNYTILQARFNTLNREVEALREHKRLNEDDFDSKMKFTEDMAGQLKAEREKAIIATAKLNALQKKQDKEKLDLMDRLRVAEEIIAAQQSSGGVRDSSSAFAYRQQQQ